MRDFFAFRLMITAGLIKVIYPLGAIAIIVSAFVVVPRQGAASDGLAMSWDKALLFVIFANIGWRIVCEQMMVFFSIHESLTRKADGRG